MRTCEELVAASPASSHVRVARLVQQRMLGARGFVPHCRDDQQHAESYYFWGGEVIDEA